MSAESAESAELVDRIRTVRFSTSRWRETYDVGEVDEFLARLADEVGHGRPVAELVDRVRFTPIRLRAAGYDMAEVDTFIEQVAEESRNADDVARFSDATRAEQARPLTERLRTVRFTPTRLGQAGYDMGSVDRAIDELLADAQQGRSLAPRVDRLRLRITRTVGYDLAEVDAFLARLRATPDA